MKQNYFLKLFLTLLISFAFCNSYGQSPIFSSGMSITPFGLVSSPNGENVQRIIDGSNYTKFLDYNFSDGMGFSVYMGGDAYVATVLEITTANDSPNRDPKNYQVLGSNDGNSYTNIASGNITCNSTRFNKRSYNFSNTNAYKYYRIIYTIQCGKDNSIQVAETQLLGSKPNSAPNAVCKAFTAQLDASGNVTITAEDVDGGSSDDKPGFILSLDKDYFDCSNLGDNKVELTITDSDGATDTCFATVTVEDNITPEFNLYGDGSIDNPFITLQSEVVGKVASGTYYFKFNNSTFQGVLDNNTAGGGWLMILNYVHQGGTNPELNIRNTNLPLLGSSTLGDNEAASSTWGHFGNTLAAALDFEEIRFYGQTSLHSRVIDFTTKYPAAISYIKTGSGSFAGINNAANYTLLGDHTASIPANAPDSWSNEGDFALTNFPFWRSSQAHWGIKGGGNRWEVDGYPNNFNNSTIHRVWVRGDLSPAASEVETEITIELNENGNASISSSDFSISAVDNCGSVTYSLSQTDFDCSNIGENTIKYFATDEMGNSSSIDVIVNVEDKTAPTISGIKDIEVDTDAGICGAVVNYNIIATDNCEIPPAKTNFTSLGSFNGKFYYLSNTMFSPESAFLDAKSNGGNVVTINDASENEFLDVAISVNNVMIGLTDKKEEGQYVWQNGESVTYTNWNPGEPNNSGDEDYTELYAGGKWNDMTAISTRQYILEVSMASQTSGLASGSEFPVGTTTNTFEATDASGNKTTYSFDVLVTDNENPEAVTKNITVELDETGSVTIEPSAIDDNSTDNCEVSSLNFEGDNTAFSQVVEGRDLSITLPEGKVVTSVEFASYGTPTGTNGNYEIGTCNATNSKSIVEGYALGKNSFTIPATNTVFGDPCGGTYKRLYVVVGFENLENTKTFTCNEVGDNTVTLIVTDVNGNISTETAIVKVEDNIDPTAIAQEVTIYLDENGKASTTAEAVNNGSSDNCTIESLSLNETEFNCSNVGDNKVVLTVTDVNGNISTAEANVKVIDEIKPTAIAQEVTIYLDENGKATTTAEAVNNGSTDNCEIETLSLNKTEFDCSNVGNNPVVLTVTDGNGNEATAEAIVIVMDNTDPTVVTQEVTIYLDESGKASTTAEAVNNGSTDNCEIETLSLSKTAFDCSNVGDNKVVLTVTDVNGNEATAEANVKVIDEIKPTAIAQEVTIYLDENGKASTTAEAVNNGSSDNCDVETLSLSKTEFDCSNVGNNSVILTVADVNGNEATAEANVIVIDNTAAIAMVNDITVQLDETGKVSITAADVDNGSSDACGIVSMSVSPNSFTCAEVGENTVTLTVIDKNGNESTTTSTVTVEDKVAAVAVAKDITVQLDKTGNVAITAADADNGSTDACGIASMSVSPNSFTCAEVGKNKVTLTVIDNNGNESTTTSTVTVEDKVAAIAVAKDITVQLDETGNISITAAAIDNGSSDVCGIASMSVSPNSFTCAEVGENTVTLTVIDNNGNESTATSTVTVEDKIKPIPSNSMLEDITAECSVEEADVQVPTATDNCGTVKVTNNVTFPITASGLTTITWSFEDANGNITTQTQKVTIKDETAPVPDVAELSDIVVECSIDNIDVPTATDNCGGVINAITNDAVSYSEPGEYMILWEFTDASGNIATQEQWITVKDITAPEVNTVDITVDVFQNETVTISPEDVDDGTIDNCSEVSLSLDKDTFDEPGTYTVTLTATDASGNVGSATSVITVKRGVPDAKGEMHVVPSILTGTTMTKVIAPLNSQIYRVQILETETNKYKTISGNKQQTLMIDVAPMRGTLLVRITDQTGKVHLKKIIVL